jgi:hypothetical protein
MDQNTVAGNQVEAVRRCQDPKPISAEEGRKMLGLFPIYAPSRSPMEIEILIARVSLDQSVRLEESIDRLEQKSSRLSKWLIYLTWALAAFTAALVWLAFVTYVKT